MAFSYTIADRISFGNKKLVIVNLTDVQNDGTSRITMGDTLWSVKALNNTDSSDTFLETIGSKGSNDGRNLVSFTSVTNDDDGQAWIIHN